jgi:hypothetical protein
MSLGPLRIEKRLKLSIRSKFDNIYAFSTIGMMLGMEMTWSVDKKRGSAGF